jgi:S1-C subfamily serine protease
MRIAGTFLVATVVVCSLSVGFSQEEDLRQRFETGSIEAAKQIGQAIELSQATKYKEALAAAESAIKADGQAQMAYFHKAKILSNLGEVPESIAAYKKCLSSDVTRSRKGTVTAAMQLGLLFAKLNELDESSVYLTQAVLVDPDNSLGARADAYRFLAANAQRRGQNVAAALALSFARRDDPKGVSESQIQELIQKGEEQEVHRILHFPEKSPTLQTRTEATKLVQVAIDGQITEVIADLWADPQGRYLVAVPTSGDHYFIISTNSKVSARKISAAGPILGTCLIGGNLYASANNPPRIDVITPEDGAVVATHRLRGQAPSSLAVFPGVARVYFAAGGLVHELDLKTGAVTKTDLPAEQVIGDPRQRFVFSYVVSHQQRWRPSTLFKAAVVPKHLLLAEFRDNTAANAVRISLSADGNWVAVAGGGGWRPAINPNEGGYGVAVFSALNLEHLQGYFAIDAYPRGVCFNPVTGQVTVIREQDAAVYDMSGSKSASRVNGPFNSASAWSGDGRYLFIGGAKDGLLCWSNALSDKESQIADTWWKGIPSGHAETAPVRAPSFDVVKAVQEFQVAELSGVQLTKTLERALVEGNANKPPSWEAYAPYGKDEDMRQVVQSARQSLRNTNDFGITIYQVRSALKKYPDCAPLKYFLGEALRQGNQPEESQAAYLDAIHADAGRTGLSCETLKQLASLLAAADKDFAALHCLTASLVLDRNDPQTLAAVQVLLKKKELTNEAKHVTRALAALPRAVTSRAADLPLLPKPVVSQKPLPTELYRTSVSSVVLVQAEDRSGSGVCIGDADTIVTSHHVVRGSDSIDVYPFAYKSNALQRQPKLAAKVVFRLEPDDLAVLKLEKGAAELRPLPVAERSPEVGERVYAIGSPGLGRELLEQSVSEGIVSAAFRVIEGAKYLQHTAAVNPGNSGGPLIDEWGRLVGVVTLKTQLENVSFAVPVETVRDVFKSK